MPNPQPSIAVYTLTRMSIAIESEPAVTQTTGRLTSYSITLRTADLQAAVKGFAILVGRPRGSLDLLNHVLLERRHGLISMRATNLDQHALYGFPSDPGVDTQADFAGGIPFDVLRDAVQTARSFRITIEVNLMPCIIKGDPENGIKPSMRVETTFTIRTPAAWIVQGLDAGEFPPMRILDTEWYEMPPAFSDAILDAKPYLSTDETRYVLQGVLLESHKEGEGVDSVVATDGRRLIQRTGFDLPTPPSSRLILPLNGLLGDPSFFSGVVCFRHEVPDDHESRSSGVFEISSQRWLVQGRFIEGRYPNYKTVLPQYQQSPETTVPLSSVSALASLGGFPTGSGSLEICAQKGDSNGVFKLEPREGVTIEIPFDLDAPSPDDFAVILNHSFFMAACRTGFQSFQAVRDAGGYEPILFSGRPGSTLLLMPMRRGNPAHPTSTPPQTATA